MNHMMELKNKIYILEYVLLKVKSSSMEKAEPVVLLDIIRQLCIYAVSSYSNLIGSSKKRIWNMSNNHHSK